MNRFVRLVVYIIGLIGFGAIALLAYSFLKGLDKTPEASPSLKSKELIAPASDNTIVYGKRGIIWGKEYSCRAVNDFWDTGVIRTRVTYGDTKNNSCIIDYFNQNGTKEKNVEIDNGKVMSITQYRGGVVMCKTFYTDSSMREECYFPSGEKRSEVSFSKGVREGMTKYFDKNGDLIEEVNYSDGVLVDYKRLKEYKKTSKGRPDPFYDREAFPPILD